jgi:hypothetical protein
MSSHTPATAGPTPWARVIGLAIALPVLVSVIVLAFLWPALTSEPRDLPIAVAGPDAMVGQLTGGIDKAAPGVFDVTTVDDRAAAVEAIETREAYGAIVLGDSPEVLTSSAASPVAAQALGAMAGNLQAMLQQAAAAQAAAAGVDAPTVTVAVTDVVPLADSDPRGIGLGSVVLPLTIGGLLGGVLTTLAIGGRNRRLAALVLYAAVAGAGLTGILQGWLGILQGSYLANAAAVALALLATGAIIAGLASLIGRIGIAAGVVAVILFAVPLSSTAAPVEFLPSPWGAVGQWLPPGAGASLLRDLSYFPAADALFPWLVLAGWAALGIVALVLGRARFGAGAADQAVPAAS